MVVMADKECVKSWVNSTFLTILRTAGSYQKTSSAPKASFADKINHPSAARSFSVDV